MIPARLTLLRLLLTTAAVYLTGVLGFLLPQLGGTMTLPLLPSGIAAAAAYRWGRPMWPAVLAATIGIDVTQHLTLAGSVAVGVGLAYTTQLFAWLLRRRDFDPAFSRASDVPLFVGAALASMAVYASFGMVGYALDRGFQGGGVAEVATTWLRWLANTSAGVLLVGPILIGIGGHSVSRLAREPLVALSWVGGVIAGVAVILYTTDATLRAPLLVFAIAMVVIATFRYGLVVAAVAALVLTSVAAYAIAFNTGLFSQVGYLQGRVLVWSVAASLCGVNLLVNALLAERDSEGAARARAEQRYATIFNASPQPLWVHDPATLRFMLVNDAAVRQYGYAREEFLSMTVAALATGPHARVLGGPDDPAAADPFEARHRARDGRVLDVEVSRCSIDYAGRPAELVFAADVTERRALGRALIDAIGDEQRRIGQEMHDGLGQELTGLSLSARALATAASRDKLSIAGALEQVSDLASVCIQSARNIVQGLSPLTDAENSLEAALEALARRSSRAGVQVMLRTRLDVVLDADLDTRGHLYRIAQEALQNALKHAQATRVEIELWVHRGGVRLSVADNGRGIADRDVAAGNGLGMRTMRFRASAIGGRLRIEPARSGGTSVVCELLRREAYAATG